MTVSAPSPSLFERPTDYRSEIAARADRVRFLFIPERRYFSVEGTDPPGSPGFQAAMGALYPVAYTLHFALKRRGTDAPIGGLEGLYWIGEPGPISIDQFSSMSEAGGGWTWRLMLPVPVEASEDDIVGAIDEVRRKKDPPALPRLRYAAWEEGACAQVLHVGPYDAEGPTIARLHQAIADAGLRRRGCHHEIYISDPGRTAAERLKTVVRQPVEPAG